MLMHLFFSLCLIPSTYFSYGFHIFFYVRRVVRITNKLQLGEKVFHNVYCSIAILNRRYFAVMINLVSRVWK